MPCPLGGRSEEERGIQEIEGWMNRLHRESLKGKTAREAEWEELSKRAA